MRQTQVVLLIDLQRPRIEQNYHVRMCMYIYVYNNYIFAYRYTYIVEENFS